MLPDSPLLTVEGLGHDYGNGKGMRDISFRLWPGEVLGVVGESGSGKTTLLKALGGGLRPDRGRILYRQADGVTVDLLTLAEGRRRHLAALAEPRRRRHVSPIRPWRQERADADHP